MFSEHFICSFGGQFWFISFILQFYLVFIALCKISDRISISYFFILALVISLCWSTFVGLTGRGDIRIWNSFFLQYLWEFVLGMILAKIYLKGKLEFTLPRRWCLVVICILSLTIFGIMGVKGGVFKLYNDIPSLIAYLSLALLFYSFAIKYINLFFIYTSTFSYEWFLLHMLIFSCVLYFCGSFYPVLSALIAFVLSYIFSIIYNKILKKVLYSKL